MNIKYISRTNYDNDIKEICVVGVWINVEDTLKSYEYIYEKYGIKVANELLNNELLNNDSEKCDHRYVWDGNNAGYQQFKCHECKNVRLI